MHENKERLTRIGNAILAASRNELYLSMRFFDRAERTGVSDESKHRHHRH